MVNSLDDLGGPILRNTQIKTANNTDKDQPPLVLAYQCSSPQVPVGSAAAVLGFATPKMVGFTSCCLPGGPTVEPPWRVNDG